MVSSHCCLTCVHFLQQKGDEAELSSPHLGEPVSVSSAHLDDLGVGDTFQKSRPALGSLQVGVHE